MHLRAARTNGLTVDEIKEVLLQTAIYCGVPAANTAFRIAQDVLAEDRTPDDDRARSSTTRSGPRSAGSAAALAGVRPDDLAATVITAAARPLPDLDPAADRRGACSATPTAPARTTATSAGWPRCWPACRSRCPARRSTGSAGRSLDAAMVGSRTIETGDAEIVLTGGVESMTRAPWVLPKPDRAFPAGDIERRRPPRSAGGWSTRPMPAGVDGLPRRGQRAAAGDKLRHLPGAAGRVRRRARTSSPTRPGTTASTTTS